MNDKFLTFFAGANGSGKSTIIDEVMLAGGCPEYFICLDNLVDDTDKDSISVYLKTMKKAEQMREIALISGTSFSFETVLSTHEKVDFIRRAKSKGYTIKYL